VEQLIRFVPTVLPIIGGPALVPPMSDAYRKVIVDDLMKKLDINSEEWFELSRELPKASSQVWLLIETLRAIQRGFDEEDWQWEEEINANYASYKQQEERGEEKPRMRVPARPERMLHQEELNLLRSYLPLVIQALDLEAIEHGKVDQEGATSTPSFAADQAAARPSPPPPGDMTPGGLAAAETEASPPDPLAATLDLIPRSTHGRSLIIYLSEKSGRRSKLIQICEKIYKFKDKASLAKARLLIKRTRLTMERLDAPLRLTMDKKTGIVSLIDR
jgi:hypothetical protein